jgi:D-alanine-D-alanine ligase
MPINTQRIAILHGGWSHETDSYITYPYIEKSLIELRLDYDLFDVCNNDFVSRLIKYKPDIAFLTNQGAYGEDGKLQGLLEFLNIPYTGSGVVASAVGMNKLISKLAFNSIGLNTSKYIYVERKNTCPTFSAIAEELGVPFIIKPIMTGSSFGIKLISCENDYKKAVPFNFIEFGDYLFEEFIDGGQVEYSSGILEDEEQLYSLPICKSVLSEKIYSHNCKFNSSLNQKFFDFNLEQSLKNEIQLISTKIHTHLGCSGFSRTDFILDKNNKIYVLEYNSIPGLLPSSIFPQMCSYAGINYTEMVKKLLLNATVAKRMEIGKIKSS